MKLNLTRPSREDLHAAKTWPLKIALTTVRTKTICCKPFNLAVFFLHGANKLSIRLIDELIEQKRIFHFVFGCDCHKQRS